MTFKPAEWNTATNIGTLVVVIAFVVTLLLSFFGGQLWARITCPILGVMLLTCWLFSVKGYITDQSAITVEHPLWSDRFELRGLAPVDRRPGDSIRLFASNWIFGHTLGLCYSSKVGMFLVYMTNPNYRVDVETGRGLLVISPRDKAGLSSALSRPTQNKLLRPG